MAEAAEVPELEGTMVGPCGRAVVIPETGSFFEAGHSPRGPFLRAAHDDASCGRGVDTPLGCCDGGMTVLVEALELRDEVELARCSVLRGCMNMWR